MTEEGEWPRALRFLVGALVGAGVSFAGGLIASTSTAWLIVISVASGVLLGVLAAVLGRRLWEVFFP
jgi:hypothetical protein